MSGSGDRLASGRQRSAQFGTGHASVDDEVVLNPGILAEELPETQEVGITITDKRRTYMDSVLPSAETAPVQAKEFPDTQYSPLVPILDRVLVMRVSTDPDEE